MVLTLEARKCYAWACDRGAKNATSGGVLREGAQLHSEHKSSIQRNAVGSHLRFRQYFLTLRVGNLLGEKSFVLSAFWN